MTINCSTTLIDLSSPKVMGILNLTPDSFYDGGRYKKAKQVLEHVQLMLDDGATFIDLGAYSSRPGATDISAAEETQRLLPMVELLIKHFPDIKLSIDTFRSVVATRAVNAGAAMINDISAGALDPAMMQTVGGLKVPYCMMHMRGTPSDMASHTTYDDLVGDVLFYFSERIKMARAAGINDLIIDPGFGFAKTIDQNFEMLHKLALFKNADLPVLVGLSRKSSIYKTLNTDPEHALNGSTVLHTIALLNGASILRVHDVKEAVEAVKLVGKTTGYYPLQKP